MYKKIMLKLFSTTLIWFIYFKIYDIYYPIMSGDIALGQMNSSNIDLGNWKLWNEFWQIAYIIPLIITVIIFWSNIKKLFNLKEKN